MTDLTHPPIPASPPIWPRFNLQCSVTPISIDPAKTALLIIDMQNYSLARGLGNNTAACFDAEKTVLDYGIPAARKAKIQTVWLTWGLTEKDLEEMGPGPTRIFGWHSIPQSFQHKFPRPQSEQAEQQKPERVIVSGGERRTNKGLGVDLGKIQLEDGSVVDGGRVLMRGTWNAELHAPLEMAFQQRNQAARPDIRFHKNINSGMCEAMTECTEYLVKENIRTLLFTGVNTDQCLMGTLQDANLKGFDTILLKDGCGTNSPEYAQQSAEYNCHRSWGFLSSCRELAEAADGMY